MRASYEDIRKRIAEEPLWFDENGAPRYDKFAPDQCADIYATQVVLLEIGCQGCEQRFLVAMSWSVWASWNHKIVSLSDAIEQHIIHYGDPPWHACAGGGDTMNCEDLRVAEFWDREFDWHRDPQYEVMLYDPEAKAESPLSDEGYAAPGIVA
jgi:hypothetical protein